MCNPAILAVATFALSAAEQVTSYIGAKGAYKSNEEAANIQFGRDQDAISRQSTQLSQEKAEKGFDTAIASLAAEGQIAASASESGLGRTSIVGALNAAQFGIGRQVTADDKNYMNQRLALGESRVDADVRRQARINSVAKPSALSLVIGLGQSAVGAASSYKSMSKGS